MILPKHIRRKAQIAKVLSKHGFGILVEKAGMGRLVPFHWGILGHERRGHPYSAPEHLRLAFEELGPTFIKLGQILSTRPDLIPEEYVGELSKLQDRIPPCPTEDIVRVLEEDLGRPVSEIFATFEEKPLASASIGQVHRAVLKSGERVVVKVQKPFAERQILEDLEILEDLVARLAERWEMARNIDLEGLFDEFAYLIRNELDYIREGRNADTFRKNFSKDDKVHIPKVYWDLTTRRVLVMEEIEGVKITDLEGIRSLGLDPKEIAKKGAFMYMDMFFRDGFFHGDPHPGNLIVLKDGRIGLVDFGMVGVLDDMMRLNFLQLLYSITKGDMSLAMDALLDLGIQGDPNRERMLRRDLEVLFSYYFLQPVSEVRISKIVQETFRMAYKYRVVIPSDLFLLLKTVGMAEGLLASLDPDFRMITVTEPYLRKARRVIMSPKFMSRQAERNLILISKMFLESTDKIKKILRRLETGRIEFSVRYEGEGRIIEDLRRDINRLSLSILALALIVALAVLVSAYRPAFLNLDLLIVVGVIVLAVILGKILVKVLREGA